jgi:hypothetical protein
MSFGMKSNRTFRLESADYFLELAAAARRYTVIWPPAIRLTLFTKAPRSITSRRGVDEVLPVCVGLTSISFRTLTEVVTTAAISNLPFLLYCTRCKPRIQGLRELPGAGSDASTQYPGVGI